MSDRRETLNRLAADALRWAVGRDEFGALGLEFFQLFEKAVEVTVGNLRPRFGIIEIVMVVNEPPEFQGAFLG
jgi:hypothetical protein